MTTTTVLPQTEGEFTPQEATAFRQAAMNGRNVAGDEDASKRALAFLQNVDAENRSRLLVLHRRWRSILKMLDGNSLERGGPEDVHVPELHKSLETTIPRIIGSILVREPWFNVVPMKRQSKTLSETIAAEMDWYFHQAKVRRSLDQAARNALICQAGVWHCQWDNRVQKNKRFRYVDSKWVDGELKRTMREERRDAVVYAGPRADLVDPFDFVIHTKATDAQTALYIGHRFRMSIDEVRRIGAQEGWVNLGKELDGYAGKIASQQSDVYKAARDPTMRFGMVSPDDPADGRPGQIEMMILYGKFDLNGDGQYVDCRMVVTCGKLLHELRLNPHDDDLRPYAIARATKNGHEFYGQGHFDNAVRLNQHLDAIEQAVLRGTRMAASPIGFAEEDSDQLPPSIYHFPPGHIVKGAGRMQFASIPDSFLRSVPVIMQGIKTDIHETVGSFPMQRGETGPTATGDTLAVQEGNRRTESLTLAIGDGLEQLLSIFYRLAQQYRTDDVLIPVLGKRAHLLRKTHIDASPANLLNDVHFDLVGLRSLRNAGMKAAGLANVMQQYGALIVSDPAVQRTRLLHTVLAEAVGPDEADEIVPLQTPDDMLLTQEEENEMLVMGEDIEVNDEDDHEDHRAKLAFLVARALDPDDPMPKGVRRAVLGHDLNHQLLEQRVANQKRIRQMRAPQNEIPPEAGGQPAADGSAGSPPAGGFSDAMQQLASEPGGQMPQENPGPRDARKMGKIGRANRVTAQSDNQ